MVSSMDETNSEEERRSNLCKRYENIRKEFEVLTGPIELPEDVMDPIQFLKL